MLSNINNFKLTPLTGGRCLALDPSLLVPKNNDMMRGYEVDDGGIGGSSIEVRKVGMSADQTSATSSSSGQSESPPDAREGDREDEERTSGGQRRRNRPSNIDFTRPDLWTSEDLQRLIKISPAEFSELCKFLEFATSARQTCFLQHPARVFLFLLRY